MKRKFLTPLFALVLTAPIIMTTPDVNAASNVFVLNDGSIYDGSTSKNAEIIGIAQSSTNKTSTYNMIIPETPNGNVNVIVLSSQSGDSISYPSAILPDAVKTNYNITIMPNGVIFDANYYADKNPDVVQVYGKKLNALLKHYYEYGATEGRLPNAGMDGSTVNVLKYKFNGITYQYAPTDTTYFTQGRIDAISKAITKFYKENPSVIAPENDFDYIRYAEKYPDLKKAFGYDKTALYKHYISYGIAEGRTLY